MSKCFITKLSSSVDNNTLPVLGQLKIKWLKQNILTDNDARAIDLQTNSSITVKVSGAHFTDSTLASNIGNTKIITATDGVVSLYVSNDTDAILTIDNKYSLLYLGFAHNGKSMVPKSVYFDIEDIRGCTNIQWLYLSSTQVSGNISAVSNLTNLLNLVANNLQISGDISAVSNLTKLVSLAISYTQITGNTSAVSNLVNLTHLTIGYTQITGAVDYLVGLTKLVELNIKNTSLTGNMSMIPINVVFISQLGRNIITNFTWTARGRQNAKLLAMEGPVPFDTASMDNMLIDQATCTFTPVASIPWLNVISASGNRTSASDAAVATLQSKGVTITGVTKVS